MSKENRYASVWDALENDPVRREKLLRVSPKLTFKLVNSTARFSE